MLYISIVIIYAIALCVQTFHLNAPLDVICNDLNPIYILKNATNKSETYKCPFEILTNQSFVEIGYSAILTIKSNQHSFIGFILQGYYRDHPVGLFEPKPGLEIITCKGAGPKTKKYDISIFPVQLAIHLDYKPKISYELVWRTPHYCLGDMDFLFSPIVDEKTFWVASRYYNVVSTMYDYTWHPEYYTEKKVITTKDPTMALMEEYEKFFPPWRPSSTTTTEEPIVNKKKRF